MILKRIQVNTSKDGLITNSYIICDEKTKETMVVDPGGEVEKIIEMLDILEAKLKYIFLTHCHADHTGGICELKDKKGGKILISRADSEGLYNEYSYEDVEYLFDTLDYQNGCSNALILEVYAYLNKSPREEGHDYIKTLIDNYYDNNLKLIKGNMNETTTSYSTNQIYLALASYKVQRDNNVKVNIFNLK